MIYLSIRVYKTKDKLNIHVKWVLYLMRKSFGYDELDFVVGPEFAEVF
jgi:hypothetical protein